jgi:hypothetical protein
MAFIVDLMICHSIFLETYHPLLWLFRHIGTNLESREGANAGWSPVKNAREDCRRHQLREQAIERPKMTHVDKNFVACQGLMVGAQARLGPQAPSNISQL